MISYIPSFLFLFFFFFNPVSLVTNGFCKENVLLLKTCGELCGGGEWKPGESKYEIVLSTKQFRIRTWSII